MIGLIYSVLEVLEPRPQHEGDDRSYVRERRRVRRFVTWRIWHLIAARALLDGLVALIAYFLFHRALGQPGGLWALTPALAGGVSGPGILRAKIFSPTGDVRLDIESRYRRLLDFLDSRISDRSVAEQSRWRLEKLERAFVNEDMNTLLHVGEVFADTCLNQGRLSADAVQDLKRDLAIDAADETDSSKGTLLQRLLDAGAGEFLKGEIKKRRRMASAK